MGNGQNINLDLRIQVRQVCYDAVVSTDAASMAESYAKGNRVYTAVCQVCTVYQKNLNGMSLEDQISRVTYSILPERVGRR